MLAHQGAVDETLSVVLLLGALWVGWVGWSRLKGKGFPRMPAWAGPGLLAAAAALAVTAAIAPRAIFAPSPATLTGASASDPGPRPSSAAALGFAAPTDGQTVIGDEVEVVLDLRGGRIVEDTSTHLAPDTGHVHLVLDGELVSMTYGLVQVVDLRNVPPGSHTLLAEYVAADHAPFDPRVTAVVRFETEGP
ncbi:MAG TPA: hypothetical protein VFI59_12460 [Actinomycetota bacterium]|nr:hypothetical protein [Actinomycetota bacterium]